MLFIRPGRKLGRGGLFSTFSLSSCCSNKKTFSFHSLVSPFTFLLVSVASFFHFLSFLSIFLPFLLSFHPSPFCLSFLSFLSSLNVSLLYLTKISIPFFCISNDGKVGKKSFPIKTQIKIKSSIILLTLNL